MPRQPLRIPRGATSLRRAALSLGCAGALAGLLSRTPDAAAWAEQRARASGLLGSPSRRSAWKVARAAGDASFEYGEAKYWDDRYASDGPDSSYDWLGDYDKFREHIDRVAEASGGKASLRVLDLGCGNSRLVEQMHDHGYGDITAVDRSEVVINFMRERNSKSRPEIRWVVGDAFQLDAPDGSYDLVLDKSTMDALSCEEGRVNQNMAQLLGEVSRVLRTGGTYLVFGAGGAAETVATKSPHVSFDVRTEEIPVPFTQLFVTAAVKRADADERRKEFQAEMLQQAAAIDAQWLDAKRRQSEADQRLKENVPSGFDVLD